MLNFSIKDCLKRANELTNYWKKTIKILNANYRPFVPYTLYVHIITAPSSPLALLSARTSIIGKVGLPGTKVVRSTDGRIRNYYSPAVSG